MLVGIQVLETAGVERGGSANNSMDSIALTQQEFSQITAILTSNT
jgi:hypothetical protein